MSIVLLDCDGVLADFVGHMLAALREHPGHDVPDDVDEYDFLRGFGEGTGHLAREILKSGDHWSAIPPFDAAINHVGAIRRAGHDVVVVTAPWWSCPTWDSVRRAWLYRHFDVKGGDVITTARKDLVRGDAFIDDKAEVVAAWGARNDGAALLMDRRWTKSAPSTLQRFSWEADHVDALIRRLAR